MRSYHSVLALSAVLSAVGCTEDKSPTGPGNTSAPELSATAAATLVFRAISAGEDHSCGVTTTNVAYCWGNNFSGQLGVGSAVFSNQLVPVAVAGGLRFRNVSVGDSHSCGVTTDDHAYCWGSGAVGDGTSERRYTPVAVSGNLSFRLVRAGAGHTC
ncbi:MAG TPA: hypothetical protein VFZ90_09455, partial [Gemmatimonadales bacterium]